jgi:hypothetical protein
VRKKRRRLEILAVAEKSVDAYVKALPEGQ